MYNYQRKHYQGRARRAYCARYKIKDGGRNDFDIKGDYYRGYVQGHIDASYNPVSDDIFNFVTEKEAAILLEYANNFHEIKTNILIKLACVYGLRAVLTLVKVIIVTAVLKKTLHNVSDAARILKIDRNTLNGILKGSRIEKEPENGKS